MASSLQVVKQPGLRLGISIGSQEKRCNVPTGVLIVDDVPQIVALVAATFSESGYTVFKTTCGVEALKILQSEAVEVLVSDVKMPGMGGPELVARAWAFAPNLGVVFMTGYSLGDEIPCEMLSRALIVTKPFLPSAIKEAVAQALNTERKSAVR
jgi:two-component system NtrC family response regulator